jgi:hypothetical protein
VSDINIRGCAATSATRYFYYNFSVGSVVYFVPKAKKGVLEPHTVKEVEPFMRNGNYMHFKFLYRDTFNAIFNEDELCSEADAIEYAKTYYETAIAELIELIRIKECNNS